MKTNELILIVEDDDAISKLLTISLTEYGFKTRHANDLAMAKREFISLPPRPTGRRGASFHPAA